MELHHDNHHKAYVDNLNKALDPYPRLAELTVEDLLLHRLDEVPEAIRTDGGRSSPRMWSTSGFATSWRKRPRSRGRVMSQHGAPALLQRTRRHGRFVLGGLIPAFLWTSSIRAQEPPILRFGGRVTYISPPEMLVALDTGRVVMLDLARIPQGEIRQFAQSDDVIVSGFIRRPSHRIIATSIQRASPWVPTTPLWAP